MKHIAEESSLEKDVFNLDLNKIKKVLAISVLTAKKDGFILNEYIIALQKAYELGIPSSLLTGGSSLADPTVHSQKSFEEGFNSKNNLFDGYQDFDL